MSKKDKGRISGRFFPMLFSTIEVSGMERAVSRGQVSLLSPQEAFTWWQQGICLYSYRCTRTEGEPSQDTRVVR